jgi:hypothetical protein
MHSWWVHACGNRGAELGSDRQHVGAASKGERLSNRSSGKLSDDNAERRGTVCKTVTNLRGSSEHRVWHRTLLGAVFYRSRSRIVGADLHC